jgi:bifunctional UDP-N-acetylglucosamine pyrophosphorylase/glucosamine-1-phosphate N-acetyltransferase
VSAAAVVILAAGKGTRMKSDLPKVMHPVCGLPMVLWPVAAAQAAGVAKIVVVVGPDSPVPGVLPNGIEVAVQETAKGTGDAVRAAADALAAADPVVVLSGDVPLVDAQLVNRLLDHHRASEAAMTVGTARLDDPSGYGRIVRGEDDQLERIAETKVDGDANANELAIREVNSGIYAFERAALLDALDKITADNAQGEYYLPDVIPVLRQRGLRVESFDLESPEYMYGVNDRVDLARVEAIWRRRIVGHHQRAGVTIVDPESTWIEGDVKIGADTTILPGTSLRGQTEIGAHCEVGPHSTLTDARLRDGARATHSYLLDCEVGPGATVGPFAYLRPGAQLGEQAKAGSFVEIKNSRIGDGAKVPHLSYVGDAEVGDRSNLGAGTITANYDGFEKHRTVIGAGVRTGVHTSFVAPVIVGDGAYTAAGSVITRDVPADALAVARSRQSVVEGYAKRKRGGDNDGE